MHEAEYLLKVFSASLVLQIQADGYHTGIVGKWALTVLQTEAPIARLKWAVANDDYLTDLEFERGDDDKLLQISAALIRYADNLIDLKCKKPLKWAKKYAARNFMDVDERVFANMIIYWRITI